MRSSSIAYPVLLLLTLAAHGCRAPVAADRPAPPEPALPEPAPPRATDSYLLWRAPGGFAGTGPAVEVQGNGIMHVWARTSGLTPHRTEGWDLEILLSPEETAELFALLAAVDFRALPHETDVGLECYPVLYLELGRDRMPRELRYQSAAQLRPEMDAVYAWFDARLRNLAVTAPSHYCSF